MAIAAVAGLASLGGAMIAAGTFAIGFGAAVGAFALGAGLSMVSRALAPKPNLGAQMRGITQTSREPAGSRKIVYGKMRVGGQVVFISNSGDDNKYLHMAIAFASHEIESYEEIWFNDKKVWTLSGGFQSDWGTYVTIDRKFGTDAQAASTDLVNANVLWTTNHKLSGIAYIAFRLEWDTDKFPQGVPNITAVLKGKKVYDPRTASTGWSQNPALCLRDYMLDDKYGLGEVTANIDSTAINAAANLCEEQVTLDAGGTQDRYQCNGVIETGNQIRANIEQLLASMGGMLTYSGGKYFIDGAEYKAPALTFTEADVISDIQTQTKQSRRGVYNGVKGIFVSEEKNYKVLDYPPQISSTYATEDGDPIYLDMALPFVTNNTQAQRLAKIALLKSRQQVVINMTVNLKGLQVKIGDTINVTNDRLNYSSKVFQVIDYSLAIADGGALAVNLACIETASAIYDWATSDEEDFLSGGELDLYDGRTVANVTNLALTEVGFKGPDGNVISAVDLTWTAVTDAFVELYKVRYNKTGTTNYFYASSREPRVYISGLDITSNYDFRVQAENLIGVSSTGTTLSNQALNGDTTAPSVPTSTGATGGIQTITAEWTNPSDIDFKHTEVFVNTSNSIPSSPTAVVDGEEYIVSGLSGAVTRYFWLKSVDFSGNKSAATASFNATSVVAGSSDIADDAVGSDQIANDAVGSDQIADDAVGSDQIASGAVDITAFASGIEPVQVVSTLPASAAQGDMAFLTTDSNLYRYNGSAWTKAITLTEVSDSGALAALSNIDLSYVTDAGNLAALNTVGSSQIDNDAITNAKIAVDAIQGDVIAAGAITTTTIADDAISTAKIAANAITAGEIAAGAVTATQIAAGTITASELAANSVTANAIAAGSVAADEIAAGAITTAKITAGAVTANEIAANTVTAAQIASDTITANQIASSTITANELAAGTITANEIASNTITAGQIAAGAINTDELAANSVNADKIQVNSITVDKLSGDVSESFAFGLYNATATSLSSTLVTFGEFTTPAPDADLKKSGVLQAVFGINATSPSGNFTVGVKVERKSKGATSGTLLGTVAGQGSVAFGARYIEIVGNLMGQFDMFGGLATSQTSPSTVYNVVSVEYQSSTGRTRIIYASNDTIAVTTSVYYNADKWTSSGTYIAYSPLSLNRFGIIGVTALTNHTLFQPLSASSTEETYRVRAQTFLLTSGSASMSVGLVGQVHLLR